MTRPSRAPRAQRGAGGGNSSSVPVIAKIRCTAGGPGTIAKRRPRPVAALLASIAARRPDESMNVTPPRSSTTDR